MVKPNTVEKLGKALHAIVGARAAQGDKPNERAWATGLLLH